MDEFVNEEKAVDVIPLDFSEVLNTMFPCIQLETLWSERVFS